jgi:hypothetical protein
VECGVSHDVRDGKRQQACTVDAYGMGVRGQC